jgi:long-chain acyl-CoA synthetase
MARPGTVGRARGDRVLSVGEDGTLWCRPPRFGRFSYWRDPSKTASAWRDGSFTVGDLGRIDADGYVFLDSRRDDLIISGGVNVYPAEVEAALTEVAGVAELSVFGLPDARWGERVCAAVVPAPTPGPAPNSDLVDALRARASVRLAAYKRPKTYVVVDALPRTATGKVQRSLLARMVHSV